MIEILMRCLHRNRGDVRFSYFLFLSVLPIGLFACTKTRPISPPSSALFDPQVVALKPKITSETRIEPRIQNPTQRDVEMVEARITNFLIDRAFESVSTDNRQRHLLDLKQYRKQMTEMLKHGCIDDAYQQWSGHANGRNYGIIDRLESFKWFAFISADKVKDGQYIVYFKCGHGMSLLEHTVFLLTETTGEPEIKPLQLVDVSRDRQTGEFQFRPAWNTLVFGSFGPSFDEKSGVLSIESKGNGSGQLRYAWKYKIENDDFVLLEYRERGWDYKGSDIPLVYP
jgi:hypothetical protein